MNLRNIRNRSLWIALLAVTAAVANAQTSANASGAAAELGADAGAQSAADFIKTYAQTDGAFLAAGLVKATYNADDLSTILQYPTDSLVVVSLTGAQLRQAFERSVSLFPQPNSSFLQLSGFEVTFSKSASANSRITSITTNGAKIVDSKTYTVAMPSSLGRGGLGFFKIWDRNKITKTFEGVTLEDVLKGKKFAETPARWIAGS